MQSTHVAILKFVNYINFYLQIADFGMSRDLASDNYYITSGGKIPVKWTAPEVCIYDIKIQQCIITSYYYILAFCICRPYIIANTQSLVMYGVMDVSCMKYGVWGVNRFMSLAIMRYAANYNTGVICAFILRT